MTNKPPFREIQQLLTNLGFTELVQPTHVRFEHSPTETVIVLRRYRPREIVNAADLLVVRKALDERGLMEADSFEGLFKRTPA